MKARAADDASDVVGVLYRRHRLGLVRLAVQLVDDVETAEDLVQDVFASVHAKLADVDDPLRYLRTAVVNRSRSALRRRRVARTFWARPHREDPGDAADEQALRGDQRRQMFSAITTLPRRQREVIVLRFYEDLQVGEIAAVLGISAGAVSTALSRALDALAALIDRVGDAHAN